MWKKFWLLGFSLLIGILVLLGGSQLKASAADLTGDVTGSVTTPSTIMEDGVAEPIPNDSELLSSQGYVLTYNWGIKDQQPVKSGDTVAVQLPATASYDNFLTSPIDVELSGSDKSVGTMSLNPKNDKQMIITFNDNLANTNTGRKGVINIHVHGTKADSSGTGGGSSSTLISKNGWPMKYNLDANNNPEYIIWQIVVDPDNKNLGDVTLTDQIGPHMTFYNNPDDSTDPLNLTAKENDVDRAFTLNANGSTVTINLKNVTRKIDIIYNTRIDPQYFNDYKWGNFSNQVSLSSTSGGGDSTSTPGTADGIPGSGSVVKNYSWGASAVINGWYLGSFELTKTALGDSTKYLSGATYDLQRQAADGSWKNYQTGLVTNAKGVLKDPSLETGTYRLIETAAPDGYLMDNKGATAGTAVTPTEFTVSDTDGTTVHMLKQSDSPNGATLIKKNPTGSFVKGATYRLVRGTADTPDDTSVVKSGLVTNTQGQVTVSQLSPGTYYFEETDSPSGYQKNTEPVKVTIKNTDTTIQTVNQVDVPLKDSGSSSNNSGSTNTSTSSDNGSNETSDSSDSDSTQTSSTPTTAPKNNSNSTSSTKAKRTVLAAVGSNSSSSTAAHSGDGTAKTADNGSARTAKRQASGNRYLPRTSGQRSLLAMLIGILILGFSVAGWRWHQIHTTH